MSQRVTIFGRDYEAMADLVRRHRVSVFGGTVQDLGEKGYSVDAFADEEQIEELKRHHYRVKRLEDYHRGDKARFADVGKGNRYEEPPPPNGHRYGDGPTT